MSNASFCLSVKSEELQPNNLFGILRLSQCCLLLVIIFKLPKTKTGSASLHRPTIINHYGDQTFEGCLTRPPFFIFTLGNLDYLFLLISHWLHPAVKYTMNVCDWWRWFMPDEQKSFWVQIRVEASSNIAYRSDFEKWDWRSEKWSPHSDGGASDDWSRETLNSSCWGSLINMRSDWVLWGCHVGMQQSRAEQTVRQLMSLCSACPWSRPRAPRLMLIK